MKVDPIIAVKNVEESSKWYQSIFACKSIHGGSEFDVLISKEEEVILCLHKWANHGHETMRNSNILPGNGLILYFRVLNLEEIRDNVNRMEYPVGAEIEINPNSHKREFSIKDPDGYFLTVSEYHKYDG